MGFDKYKGGVWRDRIEVGRVRDRDSPEGQYGARMAVWKPRNDRDKEHWAASIISGSLRFHISKT